MLTPDSKSRGSGCLGTLLSGGCGCLAFVVGAGLAIGVFGAHLLSGWGERVLEEYLASGMAARVEVSGVELSWSRRQRIQSVTVVGEDGRQVAQASAEIPSLLELLGGGGKRRRLDISILSLRSRVDSEGVDDLQRVTRVGDSAMLEALLRSLARSSHLHSGWGGMTVNLEVKDWTVDDTASGRGLVNVRDLQAKVEGRDGRAILRVERALVHWQGSGEAETFGAAIELRGTGGEPGSADQPSLRLERLQLSSGGIPLDVARSLGLISREAPAEPGQAPGASTWLHERALGSLVGELEQGPPFTVDIGPGPESEEIVGRLDVDGERMKLSLAVAWRDGRMVPRARAEGAPLEVLLLRESGGLRQLVGGLFPERFSVLELSAPLDWALSSRSFSVPLKPLDLLDLPSSLPAAMAEMQLEADARVVGAEAARVRLEVPSDTSSGLELAHSLTSLAFQEAGGATISSSWRNESLKLANVMLRLPAKGAAGGPGQLDITAPDVPAAMLGGATALPMELMAFLPERLPRVNLTGMVLPRLGGAQPAASSDQVTVVINAGQGNNYKGVVEGSTLRLPGASLVVNAHEGVCSSLLQRLLPWFAEVRPYSGDAPTVAVSVRDYSVDLAAPAFRETGKMTIRVAPVLVRLQPGLAGRHFDVGEEEWVEWGPEQVTLELDQDIVRYRKAQIPLGDEDEPVKISGILDRVDEMLSITAVVPGNVLVGAEDVGILPVELTLTGRAAALKLAVEREFLLRQIETIRGGE